MNTETDELADPAAAAFAAWMAGDATALEALRALCAELDTTQAMRATLEVREQELRDYVETALRSLSPREPLQIGALVVELTSASTVRGFDTKALDALAKELPPEWREKFDGCRKESVRRGGLRVSRPKEAA